MVLLAEEADEDELSSVVMRVETKDMMEKRELEESVEHKNTKHLV